MIRVKRNDAYGRQTLRVDCCGWESYREAVSYIIDVSPKRQIGDISLRGHPACGVPWTDFERCLMRIRITCRAKWSDQRKCIVSHVVKSSLTEYLKAFYTDRNKQSRILYGSI